MWLWPTVLCLCWRLSLSVTRSVFRGWRTSSASSTMCSITPAKATKTHSYSGRYHNFLLFKLMLFNCVLIGISHLIQFTLVPPNHHPSLTLVYSNCVTSQNTGQWASWMSSRGLMLPHFHQVMSSFWPQPNCAVWQGAEASEKCDLCVFFCIFGSRLPTKWEKMQTHQWSNWYNRIFYRAL